MTAGQNQFTCFTHSRLQQSGPWVICQFNDKNWDGQKRQAKPKPICKYGGSQGVDFFKNINKYAEKMTAPSWDICLIMHEATDNKAQFNVITLQKNTYGCIKRDQRHPLCSSTAAFNILLLSFSNYFKSNYRYIHRLFFACVFLIKKLQNFLSLSARRVMSLGTHEHLSQWHTGEGGACALLRPLQVQFSEQDWTALNNGWKLKKSYKEIPNIMRLCIQNF